MSLQIALTDDIAACLALRRAVFVEEQGVCEADEVDGRDMDALHLLATLADEPAGTARLLIADGTLKIGRVCVVRPHRGAGLGAALIREALRVAADHHDVHRAKLGAQLHALSFYEKLGFTAYGPVYDDAGIDHRDMEQIL